MQHDRLRIRSCRSVSVILLILASAEQNMGRARDAIEAAGECETALNQYWYSPHTSDVLVETIQAQKSPFSTI